MKHLNSGLLILMLMLFSACNNRGPVDQEIELPEYGPLTGSKILGNGEMVCLFGPSSHSEKESELYNLFMKDYNRIILDAFRLKLSPEQKPLEVVRTSQPWFAACQVEKYNNLDYSYQVFVPINENAVIFNGRIINHGANKIKVKVQPEFDITRPYINDHYEKYSNIYIDDYVLTFGFPGKKIPDEFDGMAVPEIMTISAGEVKIFTFVITISNNHNKAVALYEKIGSENNLEDYVSRGWENWLAKGRVPVFEDSLLTNYYKINLTSLKAMNLNGAIPMNIFRGKLPQLSPRDAFMAGRAFLESGHTKEINNILKFWAVRPMKQEGEWYVSYDASGSPSRESDERFSRQEWDSNGYYASLIFRRLLISGKLSGNLDFVRSLLQFSSDHLHGNNLLYEGGVIGRPAYIPGTNMSLSTSYFQAYELAVRVSRWLEAEEYLKTGKKIVSGLQTVWDENTQAYMDVNENISMWNTTSLYGWVWGYPDHKEFALTSEYYWQNCRKDKGGIQYFEGNNYGDDLFITTSAALAQYYAYSGFDRRYFQLIQWMKDNSNEYGHFPERIKYPKGDVDSQERISSSSRSNAEFVMALQRGALFGQFEGNEALQDDYLNAFHKYYFSGKERDSLLNILNNDSLLATSHTNDLQIFKKMLQNNELKDDKLSFELQNYESEQTGLSKIVIDLISDQKTLGYLDTLITDNEEFKVEINKNNKSLTIYPLFEQDSSDVYKAVLLDFKFKIGNINQSKVFPLHFFFHSTLKYEEMDLDEEV